MPTVETGSHALEAWTNASALLLKSRGGEIYDLIVSINRAAYFDDDWFGRFDPARAGGDRIANVANTIFPEKLWRKSSSREDFYDRYMALHARSWRCSWGTYFQRLISYGSSRVNQLERALVAVREWKVTPRNAICFHLGDPDLDTIRVRGSPCLQAIKLHVDEASVGASVFYRSHDYFNKALGNFIGIGRLIKWFSGECGKSAGSIVCYSTHAYLGTSKQDFSKFLS